MTMDLHEKITPILRGLSEEEIFYTLLNRLITDINFAMRKFYMKTNNLDCGCLNIVQTLVNDVRAQTRCMESVFITMTTQNLTSLEDIIIAVYDVTSDEVYLYRRWIEMLHRIDSWTRNSKKWNTDQMWNDCGTDYRLCTILAGETIAKRQMERMRTARTGASTEPTDTERKHVLYHVGWNESNVLGSGSTDHETWRGVDENEAFAEVKKPGNGYLHRTFRVGGKCHAEWYNFSTEKWETWY